MKKLFSLITSIIVSACINAQVFQENFNDINGTGGNDGVFSGNVASAPLNSYGDWTLTRTYEANACIKIGTGSGLGSVTTPTIALTGNGKLSFKAAAWDTKTEQTSLKISATGGTLSVSEVTLDKGAFKIYTVDITNATGDLKITFEGFQAARSRFFLDDIVVTETTMSVSNINAKKINLVKNTVVDTQLLFGADADIKIYNVNGQLVKSAKVNNGEALNLSSLPKGVYIVSGEVNGEKVSQKIIKK
ncbi:T9SS type A sorting domain-containing protein [Riemerella anatipestifer]|uniref:T9SS type A sorting domain-containing protein n=1 Tax=Riemerella anatipestifer TaxID=34085 RepID=UPI0007ED40A6|nr:T9SS type A sorting domain-containing protein [Riemerella anatipestifer]AZZ58316.1 T9SS C-terminal target domain-containing protein [Riemerella anatipestifer]MCW0511684.1 T9SS type A sorting domain-containing protein [Riemerella anatipestifer]MDY3391441.1 T9SS type A sorting domain-containing protein [Riemerella anatipestifer]MDY3519389.1 T9SS type A sorting domain-containing protein [Riemerella anatipestifer]MDY3544892.1 T9SS type A sorting domain-containing protein [Riemerella anatipestif